MSLDIYLYAEPEIVKCDCPTCGNEHTKEDTEQLFWKNITHNLGEMADAAKIYEVLWRPEDLGYTKAFELIEPLKKGIEELELFPETYSIYNAKNGWGKYGHLVEFAKSYLKACEEYPDANISVSR
jgi:hypothetical protein